MYRATRTMYSIVHLRDEQREIRSVGLGVRSFKHVPCDTYDVFDRPLKGRAEGDSECGTRTERAWAALRTRQ